MKPQCNSSTDYEFQSIWRVAGNPGEVVGILSDASRLPEWWPSVYLSVKPIHKGQDNGAGGMALLHTTGWLPGQESLALELRRRRSGTQGVPTPPPPTFPRLAGRGRRMA